MCRNVTINRPIQNKQEIKEFHIFLIGFGFVSFRDPADFTKAMREMNGKYVGSRPIKMRKSNWKDRNIEVVRQKQKTKQQMGYKW